MQYVEVKVKVDVFVLLILLNIKMVFYEVWLIVNYGFSQVNLPRKTLIITTVLIVLGSVITCQIFTHNLVLFDASDAGKSNDLSAHAQALMIKFC